MMKGTLLGEQITLAVPRLPFEELSWKSTPSPFLVWCSKM